VYPFEHVYVQFHGVTLYTQDCHTLVGVHVVVVHIFAKLGVVAHVFAGGVVQFAQVYPFEHVYVQFHGVTLYTQDCHTLVGVHVVVVHIFVKLGVVAHVFAGGVIAGTLPAVNNVFHLSKIISINDLICPVDV